MARKTQKKRSRFAGKVRRNAEKTKQSGAQYGYLNLPQGVSVFQPEPKDKVWIDIMPYEVTDPRHPDRDDEYEIAVPGSLWWKRPFKIHRNIGVENEAVVCLTSIGKPCPICTYRAEQIKKGADKDETDVLKTSVRNLYVVIPKRSKKYEEEPHIWDISQYLFQNLLTEELEEDEAYEVFPDLEEGLTLRVRFEPRTIGTSKPFPEASRIDFLERKEQYDESILEEIPNLDKVLNILTYKQLEAKFFEFEEEEEEEEEENEVTPDLVEEKEEKKKRASRKPAKAKRQRKVKKEEKEEKGNKCPFGHEFGEDAEEYDDCDDCELWDECMDAKEDDIPY